MLYLNPCPKKITHPLTQKEPLMDIDWKLHVLTYTVYRKHYQFTFKKHYDQLSKIMSWKEFGFKKGDLVFVTQNYESSELIILLDKGLQITIQNYFFLPFVKYNTVSDSPLFLKMYEENFLRDSSSHFFDIWA